MEIRPVAVTGSQRPRFAEVQNEDSAYSCFCPIDAPASIPAGGVFEFGAWAVCYAVPRDRPEYMSDKHARNVATTESFLAHVGES